MIRSTCNTLAINHRNRGINLKIDGRMGTKILTESRIQVIQTTLSDVGYNIPVLILRNVLQRLTRAALANRNY